MGSNTLEKPQDIQTLRVSSPLGPSTKLSNYLNKLVPEPESPMIFLFLFILGRATPSSARGLLSALSSHRAARTMWCWDQSPMHPPSSKAHVHLASFPQTSTKKCLSTHIRSLGVIAQTAKGHERCPQQQEGHVLHAQDKIGAEQVGRRQDNGARKQNILGAMTSMLARTFHIIHMQCPPVLWLCLASP